MNKEEKLKRQLNISILSQLLIEEIEASQDDRIFKESLDKVKTSKKYLIKDQNKIFDNLNHEQKKDMSEYLSNNYDWFKKFTSLDDEERFEVSTFIDYIKNKNTANE